MLESLSLKRNKITSLDGLDQAGATLLVCELEGNQLSSMSEVLKLSQLSRATTVSLVDNEGLEEDYRSELLAAMHSLAVLDGEPFEPDELAEAAEARRQRAAAEAQARAAKEEEEAAAAAAAAAAATAASAAEDNAAESTAAAAAAQARAQAQAQAADAGEAIAEEPPAPSLGVIAEDDGD